MEIYLDNSSTTKVCLPAAEKVMECMTVVYGNPSSLHSMGFAAEKEMTKARAAIAKQIGVKENEIIFTSGGTEANNLAVFGAVEAKKRFGNSQSVFYWILSVPNSAAPLSGSDIRQRNIGIPFHQNIFQGKAAFGKQTGFILHPQSVEKPGQIETGSIIPGRPVCVIKPRFVLGAETMEIIV